MKYKSLKVWKLADELVVSIHELTMNELPKFEMYEVGSQIRRSIKSVKANIVEGYGRRFYKQQFIYFLIIAKGSVDETADHLETLYKTKSLKNEQLFNDLNAKLTDLSNKLYLFIQSIKNDHNPNI